MRARPRAVIPLGYPYLLICPSNLKEDPHLHIYSFFTSQSPNRRICSLQLPNEVLEDDERIDVNPHVARHGRHILATARERDSWPATSQGAPSRTTGIVEDIEAVLPGVVDPECSGIPYVVYRFELPYGPAGWRGGHMIGAVIMDMTGFTVRVSISRDYDVSDRMAAEHLLQMAGVEYEQTEPEQAWTVLR